jgi:hypothetical protein
MRCHTPLQELRDDALHKVERMFMVGLKSNKPEIRRDFFALYDNYIPATLFDRLQFILFSQEWEPMANQFWLKHALVGGRDSQGGELPAFLKSMHHNTAVLLLLCTACWLPQCRH